MVTTWNSGAVVVTIATLEWNWAKTPVDGGLGFNLSRQMHVASVSKLMTGIGITRMINLLSGLAMPAGFDAKIVDFLPDYWKKGWTNAVTTGLSKITFRHLLTHRAGFPSDAVKGGLPMTFPLMKQRVAEYSGTVGGATQYSNFNYSLCRILMPVLNGNIPANTLFWSGIPSLEDAFWDMNTISAYKKILNESVFAPSGVTNATLGHPTDAALAYRFPAGDEHGWNSGDLAASAGGDGWHMSVREVLNVMGTFRRAGTIVWDPALAQRMLDDDIGVDDTGKVLTGAGMVYCKNGLWQDSLNGRTEQCVAYFLPEDMELVVFANSPILPKGSTAPLFFRSLVTNTYMANLK